MFFAVSAARMFSVLTRVRGVSVGRMSLVRRFLMIAGVQVLVVTPATLIQIMEIEPAAGDIAEMLETVINRQGWRWEWRVQDRSGTVLMRGRAQTRAAARYESERALFLLLLTMVPRQTRTW